MKSRIYNLLRSILISFEFLCMLSLIAFFQYVPNFYLRVGQWYLDEANWIIGVGVNSGLLVFSLAQAKDVLFPINSSMASLRGWPSYILLKDTTLVGIFYSAITTLFALFIFIFKKDINGSLLGLFFLINLLVSLFAVVSLFLAQINIKILLEQSQ